MNDQHDPNSNVVDLFTRERPQTLDELRTKTVEELNDIADGLLAKTLPDTNDVAQFFSIASDLEFAESDEEKVEALNNIRHWLDQWKF